MLTTSVIGIVFGLRDKAPWAKALWSEYIGTGRSPSVDDVPASFHANPPDEDDLPDVLREMSMSYSGLRAYAEQQLSNGRMVEVFFVQAVFEFEAVFGSTPKAKRSRELHEVIERRNVFAHRGGLADTRYIAASTGTFFDGRMGVQIEGDRIQMCRDDFIRSVSTLINESRSRTAKNPGGES